MGTELGGFGGSGGLAEVSVMTLPPQDVIRMRIRMMGEILIIKLSCGQDLQDSSG
jgi:hypothetical protein